MTRTGIAPRFRTAALAALFAWTTFFVAGAPTEAPIPRPAALIPEPALALACADGPSFEGHLTSSSSSTTLLTRSTTGNVFGYLSNVVDDWSCTAFYRYDGLAWTRDDGQLDGNFDWGTLINSTSVACNWAIGSTDYLKANSTNDCPDTDAEYAMPIFLGNTSTAGDLLEGTFHNDTTPDEPGDFAFIHSDCESYYGAESMRWNQPFSTAGTGTRPGANCDPYAIDSTNTTQALVVDGTPPATAFDWPAAGSGPTLVGSAFAGVQFDATDAVAGFSGTANDWDLQRQRATWSGSACGTFSNDTTTGHLTSGVTSALNQVVSQGLADATCYRWTLAAKDANGNTQALRTSGTIRTDLTRSLGQQRQHTFEDWDLGGGDTLGVNVGTGNLVITHPIAELPIRGGSFSMGATYNRHDPSNVGMGLGWRLDAFRRLKVEANGDVTFTDGDGARHTFINPTGSPVVSYTRPATLYATLTRDTAATPDRFTLTYRDRSKDVFDELVTGSGFLVREEDRFGNGIDLGYVGSELRTITDTAPSPARVINLTWTSGRLTKIEDWAWIDGAGVVQATATGTRRAHRFFYDGTGALIGWADPLNTSGSCTAGQPSGASHVTCLVPITNGLEVTKTQTVTSLSSGALGTTTRTGASAVATRVTFANADVTTVLDGQEEAAATAGTAFSHPAPSTTAVVRRGTAPLSLDTTTRYTLATADDVYARVATVARKLAGAATGGWISTATTWDSTYPVEIATVTEDAGGSLARTTTTTYVPSSLGLVAKVVEPLTATDDRWTEYLYNSNNDVTQTTVSLEGSSTQRTITRSCYTTSGCSTSATDLLLRSTIENYVDGTAGNGLANEQDVTTTYQSDAYGQRTRETRANYRADGTLLDSRATGFVYDASGNRTATIDNYVDGTVTAGTADTTPATGSSERTDLTTVFTFDTAGNQVSTADPRRAIAASATTFARDAYGRTVTDGWGTADTGGSWSGTTADHDVTGSLGTISLGSNTTRDAFLTSIAAQDAELLFKVRVDRLAVGADHLLSAYLRRQGANAAYRVRVAFRTAGEVDVALVRTAGGTTTTIEAATTSVPHATSDWYWVRARISGTTTVTGQVRLWKDGTTEPVTWDVDEADTSPPAALQGSGHVGLGFGLGGSYSGGYPVTASLDELTVTTIGGGGQALAPDDYIERTTYDALDQPLTVRTPTTPGVTVAQKTSTSIYDEFGDARHVTDFGGVITGTETDAAGRPARTFEDTPTASAAATSETTYDPSGRTLTTKDRRQLAGGLGSTLHEYDELGRVIAVASADGTTYESADATTYDALGRTIAFEVGVGSPASQKTTNGYDIGGRITTTDAGSSCATATYDYRDLPVTMTDGLVGLTCASGADTRTTTKTYDGLGRLTRAEITAGPGTNDRTTDDTFDSVGNRLTASVRKAGVTTTTTYTVDDLDQPVTEVRPDGSTSKTTYDPSGNAVDRCFWRPGISVGPCQPVGTASWSNPPTQSTSTTYDARNERIGLVDSATNQTTVYDADHNYQVQAVYLPTVADLTKELQTLSSYDDRHRLVEVKHQLCVISAGHACSTTTILAETDYAYDDNDNRTGVTEDNGQGSLARHYCYDPLDRVISTRSASGCSTGVLESYEYDDSGNRKRITVTSPASDTYARYSAEGLLCATAASDATCPADPATWNITYDTNGRTKAWNGWTFTYDPDGRLLTACKSAGCPSTHDKVAFTYDGEGRRTQVVADPAGTGAGQGPVTRDFRYQADAIVEELLTDATHSAASVRSYVVDESGSVVRMTIASGEPGAGTYVPLWNGHGDAVALHKLDTDTGSLTLANSYRYETWGRPTTTTHNSIPDLGFRFLYVGEFDVQWDNELGLGLLYMHARHYSQSLGRFLQPDPDRSEANLYAYAANNPVTELDPDGTCFIVCQLIVGAVLDTVVYLATTENANLAGLAGAVATGAVESAINPFAKVGKVAKLASAATKILGKVPKAKRVVQRLVSRSSRATSCARHSFDGDTLVTLADRSQVEIEDLRVGDEVLAWDEASDTVGAYPISAVWAHDDPVTGVVVIDGEAIATTPGHPFYTLERGWVEAGQLRVGDTVPSLTGAGGVVSSVTWVRGPDQMFDLTVADAHTFAVGDGAWVVHNANCPHPRNRSDWVGPTDVYLIRDAIGRPMKVGESAVGRSRSGQVKRAEAQVRALQRATGGRFTSEIRRTMPTKRAGVAYQTKLIERYRRRYGQDTLPLNFNNR